MSSQSTDYDKVRWEIHHKVMCAVERASYADRERAARLFVEAIQEHNILQERYEDLQDSPRVCIEFRNDVAEHLYEIDKFEEASTIDDETLATFYDDSALALDVLRMLIETRHRLANCYFLAKKMNAAIEQHQINLRTWEKIGVDLGIHRTYIGLYFAYLEIAQHVEAGRIQQQLASRCLSLLEADPKISSSVSKQLLREAISVWLQKKPHHANGLFTQSQTLLTTENLEVEERTCIASLCSFFPTSYRPLHSALRSSSPKRTEMSSDDPVKQNNAPDDSATQRRKAKREGMVQTSHRTHTVTHQKVPAIEERNPKQTRGLPPIDAALAAFEDLRPSSLGRREHHSDNSGKEGQRAGVDTQKHLSRKSTFTQQRRESSQASSSRTQKLSATGDSKVVSEPEGLLEPHIRKAHSMASIPEDSDLGVGVISSKTEAGFAKEIKVEIVPKLADMGALFDTNPVLSDAAVKSDEWFDIIKTHTHPFIYGWRNMFVDCLVRDRPYERVKVAVIDTGIAMAPAQRPPKLVADNHDRFIDCKSFERSKKWNQDLDGHGTHVAMLVLRTCPNVDLMILRVVQKHDEMIEPIAVGDALKYAVEKKADIISMSLGWKYEAKQGAVREALELAKKQHVLVFAATSNEGLKNERIAWPARSSDVISVDSASGRGVPSDFKPPDNEGNRRTGTRLTAPGEEVLSAFPLNLPSAPGCTGSKRKTGTSFATPIAAGVAALILEFCRQPPLGLYPDVAEKMKDRDTMREFLLTDACSTYFENHPSFRFLRPWNKFSSADSGSGAFGGSLDKPWSYRNIVAGHVIDFLRNKVDADIAKEHDS